MNDVATANAELGAHECASDCPMPLPRRAAPRAEGPGEHLPYQPIYLNGGGDPDFRTIDAYLRTHFNAHAEYNEAAPLDAERLAQAIHWHYCEDTPLNACGHTATHRQLAERLMELTP